MSSRPLVEGTVPRRAPGQEPLETKNPNLDSMAEFPFEVNEDVLKRGRERYDIFCSVCHGKTGYGDGMVVRRGLRQPPSLHEERLRTAPAGHFVRVMTNGFGVMQDYAAQIPPRDRWAIAAYIQALQLSQNAPFEDAPADIKKRLMEQKP